MDANEMWMEFVMVMEQLRDKYVPRFKGSRRRKQKWMDYRACRAVKKKYRAWKRYTDTPEYQSYVEFKRVRNKATAELRRSKRAFEAVLYLDSMLWGGTHVWGELKRGGSRCKSCNFKLERFHESKSRGESMKFRNFEGG